MPATRNDVARLAGVSVATVSYVLNDGPRGVSEEKRRRVRAAVAALAYRPNAIARSLRVRRTNILGLLLPDSANAYFAALSLAVEEAAVARGYQVVVANAGEDPLREAAHIEALLRLQVDGLLWVPADLARSAARQSIPALRVPVVQLDRALAPARTTYDVIESDHVAGGRLAAEHLLELGHRRVGCLAGPAGHLHARDRLAGAARALAEAGLPLPEAYVQHGSFDYESGAACAARWCRMPAAERPTAILCGNDAMAIGALRALWEAGLQVPKAVSVVGYDDVPQAAYAIPPLTTVAQPLDEIGRAGVQRLLERIEAADAELIPEARLLPVSLVVRRSTAPPPA
jgi:LacI family transcriptional regulator